ncbi:MAG: (d)CMP kinase [Bdellovibrio sp.]|nr:(d)CMP kinase [Bdellovibrio sp.]
MGYVITIDGPAASGKSSLSRELSKKLSIPWVSTGAFYRGLAYAALQRKIALTDKVALSELALSPAWRVEMTPEKTQVWYENTDVTEKISQEEVGNYASQVSHYPEVRSSLLDHQRQCAFKVEGLIAEGRDCGTVVFPQAEVKIYLTASSENRAHRRAQEQGQDQKAIEAQQQQRDQQDTTRKTAPLQIPKDALVLDTTNLDFNEVVTKVQQFIKTKL